MAVNSAGDVFISDLNESVIREVTSDGKIHTFAGDGTPGYSGDGGQATAAKLNFPEGLTFDSAGDLFIAEFSNSVVREVTTDGTIHTIAGDNTGGSSGDGGPASSAELNEPYGVALDASGDLLVSEYGAADVREVEAAVPVTVTAIPTTTTLTASSSSIGYGQTLTLTVQVTDSNSDSISGGTVTFLDGTTSLGTATLANGTASLPVSTLAVGQHDLTASYAGTTDYAASASGVSATSPIETVVGTGTGGYSGDGGPATSATINEPYALAYNAQGDLFIADANNNVVREVMTDGTILTVAGTGTAGFSGDGGPATAAKLDSPEGLAFDSAGDLFIADRGNVVIRELTTDGKIHTVAGTAGVAGANGDGGPATQAEFQDPEGLAVNSSGEIFVADLASKSVREFTVGGDIVDFAGNGGSGDSGDGGPAVDAEVQPTNVAVNSAGDVFIADFYNNVIREVTSNGDIETFVGTGNPGYGGDGGPATDALLHEPEQLAFDSSGDLFIADYANNVVREVTTDGIIHTVAGTIASGSSGDGGAASNATLNEPYGLAIDASGDLLIDEHGGNVVREVFGYLPATVTTNPTTTTLSASASSIGFGHTVTLTAHVTDSNSDSISGGTVTFKDGTTTLGTAPLANGTASLPVTSLTVGQHFLTASYAGTTGYLASASGLSASSTIETVAGTGTSGYSGDGGPATSAALNYPTATISDAAGDLFIADFGNNVIRKVTPAGVISTYAGTGVAGDSGDGGQATAAELDHPVAMAINASGDLFIADYGNNVIREVTPDGVISTYAGDGTAGYSDDGSMATLRRA